MCCSCLCNALHTCRPCLNRLLLPLLLIDLALTTYIVVQLGLNVPFACCTDPGEEDCSYDDIDGADNVGLVNVGDAIFCARKDDPSLDCYTDMTDCADTNGIDYEALCNEDVLDELAQENWGWLLGILCTKLVGLIFLIFYDITHTWCKNKDAGEEDAENARKCCVCKCTGDCLKGLTFFLLRIFFLLFGTVTTCLAVWLLKLTDRVSLSSCRLLDGSLRSECSDFEDECSWEAQNYYNVVWKNIELSGPYWADLASSILVGILWCVRISVVWYYGRHLAKV